MMRKSKQDNNQNSIKQKQENMKIKILVVAAAALITTSAVAQKMTYDAGKTTFGIRAGVNFQNINGENANGDKYNNKVTTGFNAGVNAEIPLGTGYYLQPGVLFSTKGAKWNPSNDKYKLSYVEIPVNFLYKPILGAGRMLLGFGPYVGIGVGGSVKSPQGVEKDVSFTNTVKSSDPMNKVYFKNPDAGANLLVGYELASNFSVQLNAQLGLANIYPQYEGVSNNKTKMKNTGFGISAGYRF